jgi:amino-acid N-acetyltransferase
MQIAAASGADLPAIRTLLRSLELPEQDLSALHMHGFWRVVGPNGGLLGCIGLERFGLAGLVRSMAVVPEVRRAGIASAMLASLKAHASAHGVVQLFLLTTTAQAFFEHRGFTPCERNAAPTAMRDSPEFASLCPASAVCMSLLLTPP